MTVSHYQQALDWAQKARRSDTSVILGNGFSIAYDPNAFSYGALRGKADEEDSLDDSMRKLFDELGTNDFEVVIRKILSAVEILQAEDPNDTLEIASKLRAKASALKEALANSLANLHPDIYYDISNASYERALQFLQPFSTIYSTNYDMLLYWALMQANEFDELSTARRDDGFREGKASDSYVVWNPLDGGTQSVHYLHGALHLYMDAEQGELQKLTWKRTSIPLVEQIRDQLAMNRYPLMVSEGTTQEKRAAILNSAYLGRSLRSLSNIGGGLVAFGFSFSHNDSHIVEAIVNSTVSRLAVGVFGEFSSSANIDLRSNVDKAVMSRQARIERRASRTPLEVQYFDASTALVW